MIQTAFGGSEISCRFIFSGDLYNTKKIPCSLPKQTVRDNYLYLCYAQILKSSSEYVGIGHISEGVIVSSSSAYLLSSAITSMTS